MNLVTLATFAALGLAALVAWALGGRAGNGVIAGALLGAAVALFGALWVRHALIHRPEQAFARQVQGFGVKLCGAVVGTLVFRFVGRLNDFVDPATFALSYVVSALIVLFAGAALVHRMTSVARAGASGAAPSHAKLGPAKLGKGATPA